MMNQVAITLLIFFIAVSADNTPINRTYGHLNPYFNQTSYGYYRIVSGSAEVSRLPSIWMQDDLNKRLRIDLGEPDKPGFQGQFFFFASDAYEVYADSNNKLQCRIVPGFNYTMEVSTYGEPNFGFLGRHILEEYDNISADVYVGQAQDAVGPLNCMFYCDSATCTKFLGLTVVGVTNKYSFGEYWFGDNLTSEIPPAYWFQLPDNCTGKNKASGPATCQFGLILSFVYVLKMFCV